MRLTREAQLGDMPASGMETTERDFGRRPRPARSGQQRRQRSLAGAGPRSDAESQSWSVCSCRPPSSPRTSPESRSSARAHSPTPWMTRSRLTVSTNSGQSPRRENTRRARSKPSQPLRMSNHPTKHDPVPGIESRREPPRLSENRRKNVKKFLIATALTSLAAVLGTPSYAADKPTIPVIVKDTTSAYWQIVFAGARAGRPRISASTFPNSAPSPSPTSTARSRSSRTRSPRSRRRSSSRRPSSRRSASRSTKPPRRCRSSASTPRRIRRRSPRS